MDVVLWPGHSQAPGETLEGLGAGVASKDPLQGGRTHRRGNFKTRTAHHVLM